MADGIIADTVEWLLDAREPEEMGWGLEYRKLPSVTVTSEVILALCDARIFIDDSGLRSLVDNSVDSGIQLLQERLPQHRNPDLANFALALMAHLRASRNPGPGFVNLCIEGINRFRVGSGWKTKQHLEHPNTFATCLVAIAVRELLEFHKKSNFLDRDTYEDLYKIYYSAQTFLLVRPVRCSDSGWREYESGDEKSNPAVTALAFNALRGFSGGEPIIASTVEYLCSQKDAILKRWSYKLFDSEYNLFYLGYLVGALSRHLEELSSSQLRFYYNAAELLTSDKLRLRDSSGKFAGCVASPESEPVPTVWATAHALSGLCSIPIPVRDLRQLVILMREGEELQRRASSVELQHKELLEKMQESGDLLPREEYLSLGKGKLWFRMSRALFASALLVVLGCIVGTAAVLGRFMQSSSSKLGLLAVAFVASFAAAFTVFTSEPEERRRTVSYRLFMAFCAAATVAGATFAVMDFPVSLPVSPTRPVSQTKHLP